MSISTANSSISYVGNASTSTPYVVNFPFFDASDLKVYSVNSAGVSTLLAITTNYTVTGGNGSTGSIVTTAAIPATSTVVITRSVPYTQLTSLTTGDRLPAKTIENALDKLTMHAQQLSRVVPPDSAGSTVTGQAVLSIASPGATPSWQSSPALAVGPIIATGSTTPRYISDRFADFITVKDFGAVGDGVTDDSASIQASLNFLNTEGGGTLYFPSGTYKCLSTLTGYSKTKLIGGPDVVLDFSSVTQDFSGMNADKGLMVFRGTASAEVVLAVDAEYKTNKLQVPDASVFAEGDLIELSMNAEGSFPETGIASRSGQLNIVTGVYTSTNNIVLDTVVLEPLNYTVANGARIRKITPVENIVIEGITFKGSGRPPSTTVYGQNGVRVFFGRNVTVKNCKFEEIDGRSVEVIGCHHFNIENNELYFDKLGDNNEISYGIVFSSSQYGAIRNNKVVNPRHGIVSSHLSSALTNKYYGISRFVVIDSNFITGNYGDIESDGWVRAHAGISTHNDAEFLTITNNHVSGCRWGINARTFNMVISNNILEFNAAAGVYLSGLYRDLEISGNQIIGGGSSITGSTDATVIAEAHPNIRITDNAISRSGSVSFIASNALPSWGLDYSDNSMLDYAGDSTTGTIIFKGYFTGKIQNNFISNAAIPAIRLENTKGIMVSGNHIHECDMPINILASCQKTVVVNNTFIGNTNPMSAPAASQSVVSGNHDFGTGAL
jgi:polygalacturonase